MMLYVSGIKREVKTHFLEFEKYSPRQMSNPL
jgi:hypothetical protein